MIVRWLCLIGVLTLATPAFAALDQSMEGRWQGSLEVTDGEPVDIDIELRDVDEGFTAEVRNGAFALSRRTFVSTSRRGVFEGQGDQGIMGLLGIAQRVGPEVGEPLVWAREPEHGGLVIYRLSVASDGRFALDRLFLSSEGESLNVEYSKRSESHTQLNASGVLDRRP